MRDIVNDDAFLKGPFISKVAKRGAEIISVMKKSSAASAAAAACEHMHDWWHGNQMGGIVSMGVSLTKLTIESLQESAIPSPAI